ncbi:MAG: pyruvate ferredoxin oxidoreductase delta subunit [Clostridia bacterium]|nr:pyruvate ferredoxin oxidoreductase delta subunit [Clostridia bacterium]
MKRKINDSIRKLDKTCLPNWYEIPLAGAILSEGSEDYETGSWRTRRPVWNKEECTSCLICWLFCPEMAIKVTGGKMAGINASLCKGCGVCANECPREGAMTMVEGGEYRDCKV